MVNGLNLFKKLWPFKKRKYILSDARIIASVPLNADEGKVVIHYADIFGNEYETIAFFSIKKKMILKQEFKITKKVKELPEDSLPKLEIDESNIKWPDM